MLTKKHFEGLAKALAETRPIGLSEIGASQYRQWEYIVDAMADFCAAQNPNFNRAKFLAACEKD